MIAKNKVLNLEWGPRYLLLILTKLTKGITNNVVRDKTISELANISHLSEKSIFNYLKELQESEIIDVERDRIFGKGRGVNSYRLYERIDLKPPSIGYHNVIIERILFISDLTAMQKFILIILINSADDFGVARNFGLANLIKVSGISKKVIKENLKELIQQAFIYNYSLNESQSTIFGSVKSTFYLNFTKFSGRKFKSTTDEKDLANLKITQRFNHNFQFLDITVSDHFLDNHNDELKQYLNSLATLTKQKVLNTICEVVDNCTGSLLTILKGKESQYQPFFADLKKDVFSVKAGNIENVNHNELRDCIENSNMMDWKHIYLGLSTDLLGSKWYELNNGDGLDVFRKEIYNEAKYLVIYYALRIHFQLLTNTREQNQFAIVRKIAPNQTEYSELPPILLSTETVLI